MLVHRRKLRPATKWEMDVSSTHLTAQLIKPLAKAVKLFFFAYRRFSQPRFLALPCVCICQDPPSIPFPDPTYRAVQKSLPSSVTYVCSVRANGLYIGSPRLVGWKEAGNSSMQGFFCTTLYIKHRWFVCIGGQIMHLKSQFPIPFPSPN